MNESVQTYMESVSDERRQLFDRLQALILSLYPDAEIVLSYGVPTYKTPSGRVALGYWKQGVSVYTGTGVIPAFQTAYPALKTGKGSINFKVTDELPIEALKTIIKDVVERPKR